MTHRRQIVAVGLVAILGMLTATGCRRSGPTFTVAGSTAFQPFAELLAETYMKEHPGVSINVQSVSSGIGIRTALSGVAQVGVADMLTLPREADDLKRVEVARDGIAVIVHPSSGVTNLSMDAIRAIFCGRIRNWKDVGGADHGINVVSRDPGSGTRASFEQIVGGVTLRPDLVIQDSSGAVKETVASDPNAIGYLSHGLLVDRRVKPLAVDGVRCANEEIEAGRYTLVRPIYLLTHADPMPEAKAFVDYLVSAPAQKTIAEHGLIAER